MSAALSEATCELCGRLFRANRRKYHCDHCNKYYFVCRRCEERGPKCRLCGIPLKKRGEPLKRRR